MRKNSLQKSTDKIAWDDLRTVLAVVRGGSLSAAARELQLQHSTVFRRIEEIERRLGARLFERDRGAYLPNAHAEALAEAGREMEAVALEAERRVLGADTRLSGVIRIATSELLGSFLLPEVLHAFLEAHPDIEVEVDVANRNVDLSRREADLALRATQAPPERMVGRQLATIRYAVYLQARRYGALTAEPTLAQLPWLGFDERVAHLAVARWFADNFPDVRPRLRFDSMMTMLRAAAAGAGAAVLPIFAASQEPCLLRVSLPIPDQSMPIWLLSHPDARGNARVRALAAHLAAHVPRRLEALLSAGACSEKPMPCRTGDHSLKTRHAPKRARRTGRKQG